MNAVLHIICIAIDIIVNFSLFGLSKALFLDWLNVQVVKFTCSIVMFTCSIVIEHKFTGG